MKYKKMYIKVDGKSILIGEVEIREEFNIPLNMITPTKVYIDKITLLRKEGDTIELIGNC